MEISPWSNHPKNYRQQEVNALMTAMRAGECVSLIGLSGMGKSNLLGFITFRVCPKEDDVLCILLDCNRLPSFTSGAFFHLANLNLKSQVKGTSIDGEIPEDDGFDGLHHAISSVTMETGRKVLFLIDGFDDLTASVDRQFFNLLRSLRDGHKYMLSYLLATRRPLDVLAGWEKVREFNDLFVANQIWLGPLNDSDARWTVKRFEERHGKKFKKDEVLSLLELSGNHPGLLRVLAAAWHSMNTILPAVWLEHHAVIRECELLWDDLPEETRQNVQEEPISDELLHHTGLVVGGIWFSPIFAEFVANLIGSDLRLNHSTGDVYRGGARLNISLTAKEFTLLAYLLEHQDAVCEKDDLIRAVWPEDKIFESGIRDDSLAQLIRRLRVKIEPDPSNPAYVITVPGRGYRLTQP